MLPFFLLRNFQKSLRSIGYVRFLKIPYKVALKYSHFLIN